MWVILRLELMIILPQIYMVDFSFRHNLLPNEIGGPKDVYTLEHYRYLIFGRAGDVERAGVAFLRDLLAC